MTDSAYWRKLEDIGWLQYLPRESHLEVRRQLKTNLASPEHSDWAFLALTQTGFDAECIGGERPYTDILRQLADDSRGVFAPTSIEERFNRKTQRFNISFALAGKPYSCTLSGETDWFDFALLDVVNKALADCGSEERFIVLPAVDQLINIVIVPPAIYAKAVQEGLIPTQRMLDGEDSV